MSDIFSKLAPIIKKPKFLIIAGLIGIILIAFSGGEKTKTETKSEQIFSAEEYKQDLEKELKKLVGDIVGSRDVSVVLTLDNDLEYSYAESIEENKLQETKKDDESQKNELKEGYIVVKTADGGEEALLVTKAMPKIRGVAIVCTGGDNEILREKIENAVTAALNITKKRVYICGRS